MKKKASSAKGRASYFVEGFIKASKKEFITQCKEDGEVFDAEVVWEVMRDMSETFNARIMEIRRSMSALVETL